MMLSMIKARLFEVHFQNNDRRYFGDHDQVVVNAKNVKEAMQKAITHFKGIPNRRLQEIDSITQLAKED